MHRGYIDLFPSQTRVYFSKDEDEADKFYHERYTRAKSLNLDNLNWFPWLPNSNESCFNMDAIRPKHIKEMLRAKKPTSAPGDNGILHGLLRKLPTTHRFMATMFTKQLHHGDPPDSWANSRVTLIHKGGDPKDPSNFRMIALTSCIGKLFHQVLATIKDNRLPQGE